MIFVVLNIRLPFDTTQPALFSVALLIDALITTFIMVELVIFPIIYISVCAFLWACIDDLKAIFAFPAEEFDRQGHCIAMKEKFIQFIKLHEHVYK